MAYVAWRQECKLASDESKALPAMPETVGPVSINLDPTTACNYACPHCIDFDSLNSRAKHDHQRLVASLQNLIRDGLKSVILIGGGEPTLYPHFVELVRFLKQERMQVAIVSNGSNNAKIVEVAGVLSGKDWVRFSLDSGTNETFQAMHRPKRPISLDEICGWVPKIHAVNPPISVGFSFIIVWDNATRDGGATVIENTQEIILAAQLAKNHGFNYISFKPFLTRFPNGAEVMHPNVMLDLKQKLQLIRQSVMEAKDLETDTFKVVESTNLRLLLSGEWEKFTDQPTICHMTAFRQVLSPLGVFNCPAHRGIPKARLGDRELHSDPDGRHRARQSTAEQMLAFDAHSECRNVTCLYNPANRFVQNLIDGREEIGEVLPDEDFFM
jgi:MoaA/NifB/PqqE/SkfB family radical SAM enzyme